MVVFSIIKHSICRKCFLRITVSHLNKFFWLYIFQFTYRWTMTNRCLNRKVSLFFGFLIVYKKKKLWPLHNWLYYTHFWAWSMWITSTNILSDTVNEHIVSITLTQYFHLFLCPNISVYPIRWYSNISQWKNFKLKNYLYTILRI